MKTFEIYDDYVLEYMYIAHIMQIIEEASFASQQSAVRFDWSCEEILLNISLGILSIIFD
jgi:hypothetical protein